MSTPDNSIDDAVTAIESKDYERAESILFLLNNVPATRSLRSLFLYAQVLEVRGRRAPTDQLMELADHLHTTKVEKAYFVSELATLIFQRRSRTLQDLEKAAEYLKHALKLGCHPNAKALLNNLCRICFEIGDYQNLSKYSKQLGTFPDCRVRAGLALAHSCLRLHDTDKGKAYLDGVLESVENIGEADLSWLFELLILFRRHTDAQNLLDKIRGGKYRSTTLDRLQAQVWFAEHRVGDALTILTNSFCDSDAHDIRTRIKMLFMRGCCLDETGNYSGAFATFLAANQTTRRLYGISKTPELRANYENFDYATLPLSREPESLPYVPTFMIGFPRSGTTLLETVLDTQDDFLTFSETQGIQKAIKSLRSWGMDYPRDLGLLSENQIRDLRSTYFDHNSQFNHQDRHCSFVIDKLPLNILHIPFILVLFPSAKFLLSLRHPLDACLSCFQQIFEMTSEMSHFTDLEDTFKRYAGVMSQFESFRASLKFPLLTVRYEELVANFDQVMAEVFRFLGHEPTDEYKDFHLLSNRKPVITPSSQQVTREIYKSSCDRWRNYANELKDYAPLLEDVVIRYGYTT
jgi:tetratricopeptide (TPR) repeat protein